MEAGDSVPEENRGIVAVVVIHDDFAPGAILGIALGHDDTAYVIDGRCVYRIDKHRRRFVHLCGETDPLLGRENGRGAGDYSPARFEFLTGIAVCADGCLVVADGGAHQIYKIRTDGTVENLAGCFDGPGYEDGGPRAAMFNFPRGVAIRPDGGILVADYGNNRIRLVSPTGDVATLAGSGGQDGGFADGPALAAIFNRPADVAVCPDGGVLICEHYSGLIRKITPDGTMVATVVGAPGGSIHNVSRDGVGEGAVFEEPIVIVVDANNRFAVVGEDNNVLRKIDLVTLEVSTIAIDRGSTVPARCAIDSTGDIIYNISPIQVSRVSGVPGLGPGFFSAVGRSRWVGRRSSHQNSPYWSRAAVLTVFQIVKRSSYLRASDGANELRRSPMLPTEMWHTIIGMIPRRYIGRPTGAIFAAAAPPDPYTDRMLNG